jgi:hypothetical protein
MEAAETSRSQLTTSWRVALCIGCAVAVTVGGLLLLRNTFTHPIFG